MERMLFLQWRSDKATLTAPSCYVLYKTSTREESEPRGEERELDEGN